MNWSYKLNDGSQYGMDVALPSHMDIDESRMSMWVPFADGNRRDGVGDLLEISGIRLERHRSNPVVLFEHGKQVTLPIALAEDPESGAYTVVLDPTSKTAKLNAFFYQGAELDGVDGGKQFDHAVLCEQLFHLAVKKYIRAGSIGYQVIQAAEIPPDYRTGTPKGMHLISVLMLEGSLVVMPANMDTTLKSYNPAREILSLSKVCGKPLSPVLVKSLSPYARRKTVQLGYEGHKGFESRRAEQRQRQEEAAKVNEKISGLGTPELLPDDQEDMEPRKGSWAAGTRNYQEHAHSPQTQGTYVTAQDINRPTALNRPESLRGSHANSPKPRSPSSPKQEGQKGITKRSNPPAPLRTLEIPEKVRRPGATASIPDPGQTGEQHGGHEQRIDPLYQRNNELRQKPIRSAVNSPIKQKPTYSAINKNKKSMQEDPPIRLPEAQDEYDHTPEGKQARGTDAEWERTLERSARIQNSGSNIKSIRAKYRGKGYKSNPGKVQPNRNIGQVAEYADTDSHEQSQARPVSPPTAPQSQEISETHRRQRPSVTMTPEYGDVIDLGHEPYEENSKAPHGTPRKGSCDSRYRYVEVSRDRDDPHGPVYHIDTRRHSGTDNQHEVHLPSTSRRLVPTKYKPTKLPVNSTNEGAKPAKKSVNDNPGRERTPDDVPMVKPLDPGEQEHLIQPQHVGRHVPGVGRVRPRRDLVNAEQIRLEGKSPRNPASLGKKPGKQEGTKAAPAPKKVVTNWEPDHNDEPDPSGEYLEGGGEADVYPPDNLSRHVSPVSKEPDGYKPLILLDGVPVFNNHTARDSSPQSAASTNAVEPHRRPGGPGPQPRNPASLGKKPGKQEGTTTAGYRGTPSTAATSPQPAKKSKNIGKGYKSNPGKVQPNRNIGQVAEYADTDAYEQTAAAPLKKPTTEGHPNPTTNTPRSHGNAKAPHGTPRKNEFDHGDRYAYVDYGRGDTPKLSRYDMRRQQGINQQHELMHIPMPSRRFIPTKYRLATKLPAHSTNEGIKPAKKSVKSLVNKQSERIDKLIKLLDVINNLSVN